MFLLSSLGMHTINLPSVPAAVVVVPEILSLSRHPPILGNILTLTSPKAPMKKVPTLPKAAPLWGPLPIPSVRLVPLVLPAYSQHPVPRAVIHVPKSLTMSIIFFARDRRTLRGARLYVHIASELSLTSTSLFSLTNYVLERSTRPTLLPWPVLISHSL